MFCLLWVRVIGSKDCFSLLNSSSGGMQSPGMQSPGMQSPGMQSPGMQSPGSIMAAGQHGNQSTPRKPKRTAQTLEAQRDPAAAKVDIR